jgi:hypothetical protein
VDKNQGIVGFDSHTSTNFRNMGYRAIIVTTKVGKKRIISTKVLPFSDFPELSNSIKVPHPKDELQGHFSKNQFVELTERIERENNHGMTAEEAEAGYPRMGYHSHPIVYAVLKWQQKELA